MDALFGMDLAELTERVAALGEKPYRARQVFEALYKQRVGAVEEITTLPAELRGRLAEFGVGLPEIVQTAKSVDGTERYLMRMADGETVETVWMPGGDGGERGDGSEAATEEEGEADGDLLAEGSSEKQIPPHRYGMTNKEGRSEKQIPSLRDGTNKEDSGSQDGYKRATICISSQVGCAVNCQFC